MAQIGLFFVTPEQVLMTAYDRQAGQRQGGFMTPPEGHDRVWRERYEESYGKAYDFFPRGRVAYNTTMRHYVMYHDKCLKEAQLEEIKKQF